MLPMKALRLKLGTLLAADAATLAPAANENEIALIVADFALSENLVIGDLTLASFTGGDPIPGVVGAQETGIDPITLQQVIEIIPPVGGYRWEPTVGGELPITVYGYALTTAASAALLAVEKLGAPQTLTDVGQFVVYAPVLMTFVVAPLS
jgi:hypothetical protein